MQPWADAMSDALYGTDGFYTRGDGAAAHFRTAVTASPLFADAVARLLALVDRQLGHPQHLDLVDVGADEGQLLRAVAHSAELDDQVLARLTLTAVEHRRRPPGLDRAVVWQHRPPTGVVGLIVAHELLDNVPVHVAELDDERRPRLLLVDRTTGHEVLGPPLVDELATWTDRWWPLGEALPGDRVEVGSARDAVWSGLVGGLTAGLGLAVDYAHTRSDRARRQWAAGTLTGYRQGHPVPAVPDGTCDLTAHVALDSCAAAGRAAGATSTAMISQRDALGRLGPSGRRPSPDLATRDPVGYLRQLSRAGEVAELTDPRGFGGFSWLIQSTAVDVPETLAEP